jgi:hypothetical protein
MLSGVGGGSRGAGLESGWGAEAQPQAQAAHNQAAVRAPILRCKGI